MNDQFRLSRLQYPRASVWSVILLVIVFGLFGLWASGHTLIDPGFANVFFTTDAPSGTPFGDAFVNSCSNEFLRII